MNVKKIPLSKKRRAKIDADALKNANNSSMAQNEKELIKLGKEMSSMKTNSQLIEEHMIPDPKQ